MKFPTGYRKVSLILIAFLVSVGSLSVVGCMLLGTAMSAGMVKLQFGCLPEGVMIDTPAGRVRVERLKAGDLVTGYDGATVIVRQIHQYQEDAEEVRHLKVVFEGGKEIKLSPRHRIAGIPAGELKPGDSVEGWRVVEVQSLGSVSRSFDLLTDDAGYRIQGIPVNSMIREMAAESRPGYLDSRESR